MARRLEVEFVGDDRSLDRAFARTKRNVDETERKTRAFSSASIGFGQGMGRMRTGLVAVGGAARTAGLAIGAAAALAGPKLIDLASDAEETASKFKIVFGRETPRAIRQLDEFSRATGTSKFALREQAAGLQALIRPMGLTTREASSMSVGMTKLATDLSSFNNTSVQEAIEALQSGLVGESEPLRKFGVQLSATRIQAFAYAEGIAKQGEELTSAQKAEAAYALILKDTKLAQGDATRTADSFANQFKRVKAQVTDLATELGIKLLPVMSTVIGGITRFVDQLRAGEGAGGRFRDAVVGGFEAVKTAVSTAIGGISTAVTAVSDAVSGWVNKNRPEIDAFGRALQNVATAAAWVFNNILAPAFEFVWAVVQRAWPGIKAIVEGTLQTIGGIIKTFSGILTGDFGQAWDGVKDIFSGGLTTLGGLLRAATAPFREAAVRLGGAVVDGIKALPGALLDVGKWVVHRIIDGIRAVPDTIVAVAGWFKNRIVEFVHANVAGFLSLGGWVVNRLVDGIRAAPEAIVAIGGWIRNRISEGLNAVIEGVQGLGGWIVRRVIEGIHAVPDTMNAVGGWLRNRISDGLESVKKGIMGLGGTVIDWIVDGLKAGANKLVGFLNEIVKIINKLPGVDIGEIKGFAEGGSHGANRTGGLARGGAFGRTGGLIDRPMTFMGEEAPRHPEWVIPTNPAYRDRARMLLGKAAQAIGGPGEAGYLPQAAIEGLARKVYMPDPKLMAAIAMAESGGKIDAFGPPSGRGLWQIEWNVWGKRFAGRDPDNPLSNAIMAKTVLAEQGLGAWVAYTNNSYRQFLGKGQSTFGAVGKIPGIVGDLIAKGAGFLLDQLPSVGDLPGWMQGLGKHVLGKVGDWVKGKVEGLIGVGGGGELGGANPSFDAVNALAQQFGLSITSAFRPGDPGWHGKNRARDYSNSTHPTPEMMGFAKAVAASMGSKLLELIYTPLGWSIDNGRRTQPFAQADHYDHVHVALAKGGVFGGPPFVGSFEHGGIVPADGMAMVHRGETVSPADGGLEDAVRELTHELRRGFPNVAVDQVARRLGELILDPVIGTDYQGRTMVPGNAGTGAAY